MADLVIRGMEMPKNCSSCKIVCWYYLEYGINGLLAKLSASESRAPNCPLYPLPAEHGRLIDADALMRDFDQTDFAERGLYPNNVVRMQKTIIEAEGGGKTDGE